MAFAMRNAFWVSAGLLALFSCSVSRSSGTPANSGNVTSTASSAVAKVDSQNKIELRTPNGATYSVLFGVDGTVAPGSVPTDVKVVGELEGTLLVVDTYGSIPGGMSYCQAGEESFLRVVSTACRQNIELGSPGLEWQPSSATLRVQWLSGPGMRGAPAELTLRFGAS
jgi:hypothetical protein